MIIAKQIEIRNNIKEYFDTAYDGEVIIVPRKQGKNVVILSEKEYTKLNQDHLPTYYEELNPSKPKKTSKAGDDDKAENLRKLDEISSLKENWNGNGAPVIPPTVIKKARALVKALTVQPEIFPTALETIQLEFDNKHHDYAREHRYSRYGDGSVKCILIVHIGCDVTRPEQKSQRHRQEEHHRVRVQRQCKTAFVEEAP